jgi:hypothetical protein
MDSPQAEGKESKLFLVDESQEESKYRHVPEGLRGLPMMDMGVLMPVTMRVTVMVMVIPVRMLVRFGISPVGHVEKQGDHAVPNNGQG